MGGNMNTRTITSTEAQNNFGQIIDAVVQSRTRFIIKRRNVSQAIMMSLSDFSQLIGHNRTKKNE